MSLFDFPRIHFSGNLDINVPTINNAYYFPLTIYDAMRSEPFLPPRLYFSSKEVIENVQASIKPTPIADTINGYYYIEIETVNDIPTLREWCTIPIGSDNDTLNKDYIPFYLEAEKDLGSPDIEDTTLIGNVMGYWNMWGDMGVRMYDVKVTGVQLYADESLKSFNSESKDVPDTFGNYFSANVNLDTLPKSGITTASMVETLSSQSVYANVFANRVNLFVEDPDLGTCDVLLRGKPYRFSALIYSAWRVLNWVPPMAGSARFCSTIPFDQLYDVDIEDVKTLFKPYTLDDREMQGIAVSFQTFEVFENRYDQNIYLNGNTDSNPAQCTTVGTIAPWYGDDMKTGLAGRMLVSYNQKPLEIPFNGTTRKVPFTPVVCRLKDDGLKAVFSVDMGNSWPEKMNQDFNPPHFMPAKRGEASFETYPLGRLSFRYGDTPDTEFYSIDIDPQNNPRSKVFETGCIFDKVFYDQTIISQIKNNFIKVFLSPIQNNSENSDANKASSNPEPYIILEESLYYIATDQKGLYANEGDNPADGYFVYSDKKEPCVIRIFQKGNPVTSPIPVYIGEYTVLEAGNDPLSYPNHTTVQNLKDQDPVVLSTQALTLNNNAIFYFVYNGQYPDNKIPKFNDKGYRIMDTGSFVCLRVHPFKDYSQYTNKQNWNTTPPNFEVVYNEVFKLYDIVYPVMAKIHPFTKEVWDNCTMAGLVLQRTDPFFWNDILYMPKSRELSASQRQLLEAWAEYLTYINQES